MMATIVKYGGGSAQMWHGSTQQGGNWSLV